MSACGCRCIDDGECPVQRLIVIARHLGDDERRGSGANGPAGDEDTTVFHESRSISRGRVERVRMRWRASNPLWLCTPRY